MAEVQAQNPIRGSGSSMDCDWWFHHSAVLIEAPGRLLAQGSIARDDHQDWDRLLGFLGGLPSSPAISGILLLVNARNLLDPELLEQETQALSQRITELRDALGEDIGFLLVLTHMDSIAGFSESFEQASPIFRHQYWGIPLDPATTAEHEYGPAIATGWDDLIERLDSSSIERSQAEPLRDRRIAGFAFPSQLSRFKPRLLDLIEQLFDSHSQIPRLNGVYFSSATQQTPF